MKTLSIAWAFFRGFASGFLHGVEETFSPRTLGYAAMTGFYLFGALIEDASWWVLVPLCVASALPLSVLMRAAQASRELVYYGCFRHAEDNSKWLDLSVADSSFIPEVEEMIEAGDSRHDAWHEWFRRYAYRLGPDWYLYVFQEREGW